MPSASSKRKSDAKPDRASVGFISSNTDDVPTIISPRKPLLELVEEWSHRRLAHFEIIEPIGVGGMGAVLKATDLSLGRLVALKVLPPELADDEEHLRRFQLEAKAAARLDHPNIAQVYFFGSDAGLNFIAFEFVDGENLKTMLARGGPPPVHEAVQCMLQIAQALAHAAARGVVHRDLKPSNVIVTPDKRAKIVDMGLARLDGPVDALTRSGATLGSYDYISPEQALDPRSADARSDIYSLGCTFYHWLTGSPPVPEGTAAKKLHFHQSVKPADPRSLNPALPEVFVDILARMMAKDPIDRYQTPDELIADLEAMINASHVDDQHRMNHIGKKSYRPTRAQGLPRVLVLSSVLAVIVLIGVLEWISNSFRFGRVNDSPRSVTPNPIQIQAPVPDPNPPKD